MRVRISNARAQADCALCLRKLGYGLARTAKALHIGKATVHRIYVARDIKTDPRRNGVALKGQGQRPVARKAAIRRAVNRMVARVAECLRKPPPSPVRGMSDREAFYWRYHNEPEFYLYQICRRRMKRVLNGIKKAGKSTELLGCTTAHLRKHIESQFETGMHWSNRGTGEGKWHVDHEIPCSAFDLTREDQQRTCFHWTNLRPMWSLANMSKGRRMDAHATPYLPIQESNSRVL